LAKVRATIRKNCSGRRRIIRSIQKKNKCRKKK